MNTDFCRQNWFRFALLTVMAFATGPVSAQQAAGGAQPVKYDAGTISALPARNIGSATMSGRVAAVPGRVDRHHPEGVVTDRDLAVGERRGARLR